MYFFFQKKLYTYLASILVCNFLLNKMVFASSLPVLGTHFELCAWSDKMFCSQANLIRMSWNEICETWMDSQSIQKVVFIVNQDIPIPVTIVSALKLQCRVFTKRFKSRVFLQRQLWIVNYYVKSSSNNLSKENIKTGVSREKK